MISLEDSLRDLYAEIKTRRKTENQN